MLLLKYLLLLTGWGLLVAAAVHAFKNLYQVVQYHRQLRRIAPGSLSGISSGSEGASTERPSTHGAGVEKPQLNWTTAKWAFLAAWLPLTLAAGIVVVPSGMGGIRVSQTAGTRPGTLYPGVHLVRPLLDSVVLYDIRDQVLTTSSSARDGLESLSQDEAEKKETRNKKADAFSVQSKEGLNIGLAITVRYKLDPRRLDFIHANLPQPVEKEIVPPVVSSVFRELAPGYTVREVFATKREEIRQAATERITRKLEADGIIVKEVMLRDVVLPEEYAKGLEGLLLKEQQNEGMGVETEMKTKQVKIAELEAEAARVQQVKQAQGAGEVRVLQAKSEADAMQYTLPLKQKQIEQSRLEAEAQKEVTVKNAEAQAQAKVIDSKAELERRSLLADAEADRIRKVALADAERMKSEASLLKENPLLINKIVAERMSDKLQIMMVPSDAKIFFNDVMKSGIPSDAPANPKAAQAAAEAEEDPDQEDGQPAPARQTAGRKTWKNR
ncbi:MAG TPA: SPFH domain-containing protein [Candidatus Angelobacter sp.]|nr:SPFH domain-containing protein [Candidatus Angelobacter sp.]